MNGEEAWKGSEHYLNMEIQPVEIMRRSGILCDWCLGNAIKYILRSRTKNLEGGLHDIEKAIHCLEMHRAELK